MPPKKPQSSATVNHHHHSTPASGNARKAMNPGGSRWHWTNERHMHFLNSMEASFVESMFGGENGAAPPLDRYLPDSAESTQDLAKERRARHHTTPNASSPSGSSGKKTDKKARIHSCQKSSQDQVVPQFHNKRDDEDDDVPLGTTH